MFTPIFPNLAGMIPLMAAAETIITEDFADALEWAYGAATPGPVYARIQNSQRHSSDYPLLILQPGTDNPAEINGGIQQDSIFDVEIFVTKDVNAGGSLVDDLIRDLIRYYDATRMAWMSAGGARWRANFPAGEDASKIRISCSNANFGQALPQRTKGGLYLYSVAFELRIQLTEAQ